MDKAGLTELGRRMFVYCEKFGIPHEFLFDILGDQKVIPMIRGKAMEYSAFIRLKQILPREVWDVQKLNLNAQRGIYDEDISVTHKRTGVILKVESKSTVRGSFRDGTKSRIAKVPHFNVKCHRSRSNIKLALTSNDRYSEDAFDILLTTPINALFEGNTIGENFEIVHNDNAKKILYEYYKVRDDESLITACSNDWRFTVPSDIAEDGFIPRTPVVLLRNDPHWNPIVELENRLEEAVKKRRHSESRRKK